MNPEVVPFREYVKLARRVMDACQFSYFAPRGLAIAKCAQYLKKVHSEHPEKKFTCLEMPYVAKHYYITQNNLAWKRQTQSL